VIRHVPVLEQLENTYVPDQRNPYLPVDTVIFSIIPANIGFRS
jgi:hypothetical protein